MELESFHVRLSWLLLFVCVGISSGFGQTARKQSPKELPPSAFKLISVKTTGTKRYKSEEIVAASGLQIGETVSEDDFKKAARILGETGAFGDVPYSFQYSSDGTKLDLQVQDAEQFVPVRFDNLVWFSDQELLDQLHAQVPLFQGQLPAGGDLADQVSNALQGLLIEHNVQGKVDYLRAAHEDGPIEAFVFTVTGPRDSHSQHRYSPEPSQPNCLCSKLRPRSCKAQISCARSFACKRTKTFSRFISGRDI